VSVSRIRTLKPQILEDEKVAQLSDSAYRLFTSMIVLADDHGNVRADVTWIRGQIWHSHETPPNVLPLLLELVRAPLICVYAVRGGTYAHLLGWYKHQRIDNAGKPRVPAPDDTEAQDWPAEAGQRLASAVTRENYLAGQRLAESLRESPRVSAKFGSDQEGEGEEERECARDRAPSQPSGKRSRIPEDWKPSDGEARRALALGLDIERESEKFRQHYKSTGQRFVDWSAAFLKWLERGSEYASERPKRRVETREIGEL
jgi:hypothetical protein